MAEYDIDALADEFVELDLAELEGHMTYPDILGKWVGAQAVHQVCNEPAGVTGHIGEWGLCVAVGPLGFVLEMAKPFSTHHPEGGRLRSGTRMSRRFYPWSSCVVTWVVAEEYHPDDDHTEPMVQEDA